MAVEPSIVIAKASRSQTGWPLSSGPWAKPISVRRPGRALLSAAVATTIASTPGWMPLVSEMPMRPTLMSPPSARMICACSPEPSSIPFRRPMAASPPSTERASSVSA